MAQDFEVSPLKGSTFAARMDGLDLSLDLDGRDVARIVESFYKYQVLIVPGQGHIRPADQVRFTRIFGHLETHVQTDFLLDGHPEIFVLSNIVENGRPIGAVDCALTWHSDSSYIAVPSMASVLHGVENPPEGATTSFASMYQPYEALSGDLRKAIAGKRAIHDYLRLQQFQFPDRPLTEEQKRKTPPVAHPIAPRHPVTGRRSLFLGGAVIAGVEGMPENEGLALMDDLRAFATQPQFVHEHRWSDGDIVMWDNRCTLHRGSRYDVERFRRRMHRTTVAGQAAPEF